MVVFHKYRFGWRIRDFGVKRFVVLSFIFLGLGFYELSGGGDFDPQEARAAAVDARIARAAEKTGTLVAAVSRPSAETAERAVPPAASPDDTVTRTQLDLVSFEAVAADTAAASQISEAAASASAAPETPIAELATQAALEDEPLSLASLETPVAAPSGIQFSGSTQVAASTPTTGFSDIRSVKGDLVNMRSGPGTDYDVVDQLPQATRVEVISSNGNGWVELRRLDSSETGWIAEFLLTSG